MILFLTSDPVDRPGTVPRDTPCPLKKDNGFAGQMKAVLPEQVRILFIEAAPDEYARNDGYADYMREAFRISGIFVAALDVCDHRKIDYDLNAYNLIILGGGHVPTQNAFFRELHLAEKLQAFDGVVMGISAGTMNCASTVYAQPELEGEAADPDYRRFIPGLGLTEINVLPHWQMIRHEKVDGLDLETDITLPDSMGRIFHCIADGSFIFVKDGISTLYGQGWRVQDGVIEEICRPCQWVILSESKY